MNGFQWAQLILEGGLLMAGVKGLFYAGQVLQQIVDLQKGQIDHENRIRALELSRTRAVEVLLNKGKA